LLPKKKSGSLASGSLEVYLYKMILDLLLKEHSRAQKDIIVEYVLKDEKNFKELMTCFFEGEARVCQRAAYPLLDLVLAKPRWFNPYFKKFLKKLDEPKNHPAILRNTIRILAEIDIPKKYEMQFLDKCIEYIMDNELPVAIRAFAITVAGKITKPHTELYDELKMIVYDQMEYPQKPAFRYRANKILR